MFDFGNNVNVALCLCGYCVPMSTHIEFVCCLEKAGLPDRADRCLHELCLCLRHLSMTQCWEYRSVIYVRFACRLVRSTKVGSR